MRASANNSSSHFSLCILMMEVIVGSLHTEYNSLFFSVRHLPFSHLGPIILLFSFVCQRFLLRVQVSLAYMTTTGLIEFLYSLKMLSLLDIPTLFSSVVMTKIHLSNISK